MLRPSEEGVTEMEEIRPPAQLESLLSLIAKTMNEQIKLGVEADLPKWRDSVIDHLKDQLGRDANVIYQRV